MPRLRPAGKYFLFFIIIAAALCFSRDTRAQTAKQPMTVNGDTVEFKSEGREMTAEGRVEVIREDSKMTCDKVRVFIDEKLAIAEGHVRLTKEGASGIEGEMMVYDFDAQTGTIINPQLEMAPYYGRAKLMEKLSETEFLLDDAALSTCDLPHPHYTLRCRQVAMKPGRILTAKKIKMFAGDVPVMYMPRYSQRLTDKRPVFLVTPGSAKLLGVFWLGSWRYYLNDNLKGLLHLDVYQKKGLAEGIDLNYNTRAFGQGNAKYYRIDARDTRKEVPIEIRENDERSRIEVRHQWNITPQDTLTADYFRQSDVDFRKDFFFREYEKETTPKTFFLLTHLFPNGILSFLSDPRVNRFDSATQRLPELKLDTIDQKLFDTPFYYKNTTTLSNFSQLAADSGKPTDVFRAHAFNQFSYPFRFMAMDLRPFFGHQDAYYRRGVDGKQPLLRGMFFSGADASITFYKIYDTYSDFMGLDINKLRHALKPTIQYSYQHSPTLTNARLLQLDSSDSLEHKDAVVFGLENRLSTKRGGQSVDLLTYLLTSHYNIEHDSSSRPGFQDVSYRLELRPYALWSFDSNGEYDTIRKFIKRYDTDLWLNLGQSRTTMGYRFKKAESAQLTTSFKTPLNPFWKLGVYGRFEFFTGNLLEQEYSVERDLHCWTAELVVNHREKQGVSFLVVFRLKAFPELSIEAERTVHAPRIR